VENKDKVRRQIHLRMADTFITLMFGIVAGLTIAYVGVLGYLTFAYDIYFDSAWFIMPGLLWSVIIIAHGCLILKKPIKRGETNEL